MANLPRAPVFRPLPVPPPGTDWIWSTPDVLLNPPGLVPFALLDWPNPGVRPFTVRGDVWASPQYLLSVVQNPFYQTDWQNPTLPRLLHRGEVWGTADTLTNPPGSNPTALFDWPNPRGYPYPIELRTFLQGVNLPANPPISATLPFSLLDWPNPRGPVFPLEDRGFTYSTDINLPVPPPVPPAPTDTNTPGRVRHIPSLPIRGETDEEKRARRIREGTVPASHPSSLPSDDGRLAQYTAKSQRIAAAIARLRDETATTEAQTRALNERIAAATREKVRAKLERELMLKEQALQLARTQEAALLEELTVIDIAYVSVIALGAIIQ